MHKMTAYDFKLSFDDGSVRTLRAHVEPLEITRERLASYLSEKLASLGRLPEDSSQVTTIEF